jgi:hypothetical protein
MSEFSGLMIQDESGEPEEFSDEAATGVIAVITSPPLERVPTDTGGFYLRFK